MRFARITLQHFRNLPLVEVTLTGKRTFLCGPNGQGKTNFLEALGYVTALRSFRGAETKALMGFGQKEAGMAFSIEHEVFKESRVTISLKPQGREVMWEQGKVTRLGDYLGKFPTVVFSSQDNQFLRGSPSVRRRWLDLTLAAMDGEYLAALQRYTRAVTERNVLLKQGARDASVLGAFENEAATHGAVLIRKREAGVAELSALFLEAHRKLVPEGETATLTYAPDLTVTDREELVRLLAAARPRDLIVKATERGPHRADVDFLLNGRSAKLFASEGQQRAVVIALRLAQAAYYRAKGGVTPVLLCDDVLGELDPVRRARFWNSLEGDPQVVATGTSLPEADGAAWQMWQVAEGGLKLQLPSSNDQS